MANNITSTGKPQPTLPPLRETIAKYGLKAEKKLGQNFLLDEQLLDRIAAIPGDLHGQNLLEIGPGLAALPAPVCARGQMSPR